MSSRENCNTYIINGVVEIRSYQAYLNLFFGAKLAEEGET